MYIYRVRNAALIMNGRLIRVLRSKMSWSTCSE